jgi:DNA-directed RNA polymerase specialized sigma24 family protein
MDRSSDEALLLAARRDADAFAEFYRRHARPLAGFLVRRTGDAEAAADLLAETFASALSGLDRFDPARGDAAAWLYGIARHQLARRVRRGSVEERARHARVVQEQDYEAIAAASGSTEPAVRQRVSRGLATLRSRLAREEQR